MRNIKLLIQYDGGKYRGWQRLKNTDNTIQGKLEAVISKMVGKATEVIGSGRTDAGVHAKGQVANFYTDSHMKLKDMQSYINRYLPMDIVVKEMAEASDGFHSRLNAKGKKYTYYIWNKDIPMVFQRQYSYHVPDKLDIVKMKKAAEKLIGTHDFKAFSSVKKTNKTTIRTIKAIDIIQENGMVTITFVGDGFLYNMIRILVGTLISIGLKEEEVGYIDEIFSKGERKFAGITVPPQGLFLEEVYYN